LTEKPSSASPDHRSYAEPELTAWNAEAHANSSSLADERVDGDDLLSLQD
jgi:hypothetical protein